MLWILFAKLSAALVQLNGKEQSCVEKAYGTNLQQVEQRQSSVEDLQSDSRDLFGSEMGADKIVEQAIDIQSDL